MYLRRFYFIILVYANLKMEYDTKDKTFWKRKGNDMKVLLGAVNAKYIHSNLAVYCLLTRRDSVNRVRSGTKQH